MSGLITLLFLSSLILLIVGFFNPQKSLFWMKGIRTQSKSIFIYGLILFFSTIFMFSYEDPDKPIYISVDVIHDNTHLIITNNDSFDYKNAELEINGKYNLKWGSLNAGETYRISHNQFTDRHGHRFNYFSMKPKKLSIICDLENGKKGLAILE